MTRRARLTQEFGRVASRTNCSGRTCFASFTPAMCPAPTQVAWRRAEATTQFFKDFHLFETRSRNRKENANKPKHKKQLKLQSSRLTMSRFRSQNALPFSSAGWFVPLLDPVWIRPYFNRNHLTRWHQQPIRVR